MPCWPKPPASGCWTPPCTLPKPAFAGHEMYPEFIDKAAVLVVHLARNHPLPDGNKRLAWSCLTTFCPLNDRDLEVDTDDAVNQMLGVAAGEIDEAGMAEWLSTRLVEIRRSGRSVAAYLRRRAGASIPERRLLAPGVPRAAITPHREMEDYERLLTDLDATDDPVADESSNPTDNQIGRKRQPTIRRYRDGGKQQTRLFRASKGFLLAQSHELYCELGRRAELSRDGLWEPAD